MSKTHNIEETVEGFIKELKEHSESEGTFLDVYWNALLRIKLPTLLKDFSTRIKEEREEEILEVVKGLLSSETIKVQTGQIAPFFGEEVITIPLDHEETGKLARKATIREILDLLSTPEANK